MNYAWLTSIATFISQLFLKKEKESNSGGGKIQVSKILKDAYNKIDKLEERVVLLEFYVSVLQKKNEK